MLYTSRDIDYLIYGLLSLSGIRNEIGVHIYWDKDLFNSQSSSLFLLLLHLKCIQVNLFNFSLTYISNYSG